MIMPSATAPARHTKTTTAVTAIWNTPGATTELLLPASRSTPAIAAIAARATRVYRRSCVAASWLERSLQQRHDGSRSRGHVDEHPARAARPPPVVALALASRHGARHHVDPRRARSHGRRLARTDAAAGRHARAL